MASPVTPKHCVLCGETLTPSVSSGAQAPRFTCPSCGHRVWLDPKIAVAMVVWLGEGIVLLRRAQRDAAHGMWILPGGFVDRGEAVEDAAAREVFEETALEVDAQSLLGVYSYAGNPVVLVVYEARAIGESVEGDAESIEIRAFSVEEIPWDDLGFRSTGDALRKALELRKGLHAEGGGG